MFSARFGRILLRLFLDIGLCFTLPAIFLFFYLRYPAASQEAILPHLWIVLLLFSSIGLLRIVCELCGMHARVSRPICVLITTIFVFLMVVYYPIVLIGLSAWGQVISWDLIRSYAKQAPQLAEALEVSLPLTLLVLAVVFAGLFASLAWYFRKFEWVHELVSAGSVRAMSIGSAGAASIIALSLFGIFHFPVKETTEPIVTTFFPRDGVPQFRGFGIDTRGTENFDHAADEARAAYKPNAKAKKRNLILIVVDALRPDHLGIYGYARNTTPHLNRIAKEQSTMVVQDVRASCAESACGLFSMASSKFFHEVSARPFTLQEVLRMHGYEVHMILGGDHTNFYGLRKLYGNVDSYFDGSDASVEYANGDKALVQRLSSMPNWHGKPVMFQFHLMSAHPLGLREAAFKQFVPATNYSLTINRPTLSQQSAVNFYDNGVLQTDHVINELLGVLKSKGYLEEALVVLTADHGESLGENGEYSHASGVREPMIRIPLVFISYGSEAPSIAKARASASQVDIAPTILFDFEMLSPSVWRGRPLQHQHGADITFFQQGDIVGLFDFRHTPTVWKYWRKLRTMEEFLYDVASDPLEQMNLVDKVNANEKYSVLRREWRASLVRIKPVAEAR